MNTVTRIVLGIIIAFTSIGFYQLKQLFQAPDPPQFDFKKYWGPGDGSNYTEDAEFIGNRIYYEDKIIEQVKRDLNKTFNFHEPIDGAAFEYGFNSKYLKEFVKYWREDYMPRWRGREIYLWRWPHYTTYVQGLFIHYLHTRYDDPPKGKKTFPLLLIHGWPSSPREFYDEIHMLADKTDSRYLFETVVPSTPGHGWSHSSSKPGFDAAEAAIVLRNLMLRLGYEKFFIQATGRGSIIGSNIAALFPENVLGYYSTACAVSSPMAALKTIAASFFPSYFVPQNFEDIYRPLSDSLVYLLEEGGYLSAWQTRPDTIGMALTDNPIGVAAYILDQFSLKSDRANEKLEDGGLTNFTTNDGLLDNVMLYYLTNSITTAERFQSESRMSAWKLNRAPVTVPVGCGRFRNDRFHQIDWVLKEKYSNLVHSSYNDKGGHFVALEMAAELIYNDFIKFVKKVDQLYQLVSFYSKPKLES